MKYTKIDNNSYNLHIIQTDKFKTINILVNFKRKLVKEEISKRNMLVNILFESTKKYPSKRLMQIETEELYNLGYRGSNYASGIYNIMGLEIFLLNDKYTEKGNLESAVTFLSEVIFNPNTRKNSFNQESFNLAYNLLDNQLNSLRENTGLYSQIRMLETMDEDSLISYRSCGYKEDLEAINATNLYEYYKDIINNDIVDIFIIGDVDIDKTKELFDTKFKFKDRNWDTESHFYNHELFRDGVLELKEKQNLKQSKLVMGLKIKDLTDFETRYVLNVYTYILGGSPDSKLFKNIREKNSLCYSISASSQPLTNLLVIRAGINGKDYNDAVKLIKEQLDSMIKGDFVEADIDKAKITYINSLSELEDNPGSLISLFAGEEYLHSDDLKTRIEKINKVTMEDVINISKKISLDTIYLLEGDVENE